MPLSDVQIDGLMQLIDLTRERELNCDECLAHAAECAERELAGKAVNDAMEAVQHHLDLCFECREEYQALLGTLQSMKPPESVPEKDCKDGDLPV